MRSPLRKPLKELLSSALAVLPQRPLFNIVEQRRLPFALDRLTARGLELNTVYDIGAHKGEWTRATRKTLKRAKFILFEGNSQHIASLRAVGSPYFIALLSSSVKTVQFFATGGTGDSYFAETTGLYSEVAPTSAETTTLDLIVGEYALPKPDFIKVDTQGSELDVLSGASDCLQHCSLILLECPLVDYNNGAPNIHEYLEFLKNRDFVPFELTETHIVDDILIQADLLFLRRGIYERLFARNGARA